MKYYIGSNGSFVSEDELYHYGVKGMKWGVRRYLRRNGRITEAGDILYKQVDARESTAAKGEHGRKVLAKYEKLKTAEQKQADKAVAETNRRLHQSRMDRKLYDDFDFWDEVDKPYSKLGKIFGEVVESNLARERAYLGASWYRKYNRELARAIDKDNRKRGDYT